MSLANSRMLMFGVSHLLTSSISAAFNYEQSLIPIRNARLCRAKKTFLLRHDVSKEVSTRFSFSRISRSSKETDKFNGIDHEVGFKVSHRPEPKKDEDMTLMSFLRPDKHEAAIFFGSKECRLMYKHVKKLRDRVEA